MHSSSLLALAASIAAAQAVYQGFNYGNTMPDGSNKVQADYEAEFKAAQNLAGTSGWTSARLYTMIQGGTTDSPIEAIQAAIDTKTSLLLGLWASAGDAAFANEISALKNAIEQYGSDLADLVAGISVGSEDLYRETPTGIKNDAGPGASPDTLVQYIKDTRSAISGTTLSGASVGHVDTWNAWQNSTVSEVAENCDWLGMDTYPYYQTTVDNSIAQAKDLFWEAYNIVKAAGSGKPVWITETGWPTSGATSGSAVASTKNAETYWQEIACELEGNYNTWWFTLSDTQATASVPYFGVLNQQLSPDPLYDLSCTKNSSSSSSSSSSTASATGTASKTKSGKSTATATGGSGSGSGSAHGSVSLGAPQGAPTGGVPFGSGNSTSPQGGSAAPSAGAGATTSMGGPGASATSSGAPMQQTGNSASKAVPAGAALLALFGLAAAL